MDFCLIAYSWSDPLTWLALLAAIVGLGFVIFVHELGHFLVAKACGVRVDKFYLGFDIGGWKLWKFRRGETEYGIGVLPLGGYVKMLGQEDNPAKLREEIERAKHKGQQASASGAEQAKAGSSADTGEPFDIDVAEAEKALYDPRSYLAKSVPQRMAIISAGVIMNMIFAWIMAIVAFGFGVERWIAGVGRLIPGQGAWRSGMKTGDEIVEVADRKTPTYFDMKEAVVLGDVDKGLPVVVLRPTSGGQKEELRFVVSTHNIDGAPAIGIGGAMPKCETAKEDSVPPVMPGAAAAKSEPAFKGGDKIIAIDDQKINSYANLARWLALKADQPITVTVERAADQPAKDEARGEQKTETVQIAVKPSPMLWTGAVMEMGDITAVQDGSPAAKAGIRAGDRLLAFDGQPVGDPLTLPDSLRRLGEKEVKFEVRRDGQAKPIEIKVQLRPGDEYSPPISDGNPVAVSSLGVAYQVLNQVASVAKGTPADKAGMQAGDVVTGATLIAPPKEDLKRLREEYQLTQTEEIEVKFDEKHLNWPYLMMYRLQPAEPMAALPGTTVRLQWARDGETYTETLKPIPAEDWFHPGRGLLLQPHAIWQQAHSIGEAFHRGSQETLNQSLVVFRTLQKVGSGQVSARNLGGPITIVRVAIAAARQGPGTFLLFLTLLSANLAVINFLPIPVLDGGHLVFLAYEGIRGKPADERVQLVLTYIGLLLILALMVFVLGLDFGLIPRPGR